MFRICRTMTVVVGLGLLAASVSAYGDQTFGAGVKLSAVTDIKALYAAPEKFIGKTIRIDGVVTAVCEEMGCWVAIADTITSEQAIRFKVEDNAGIVFPMSARGKHASAEGVFVKLTASDTESMNAAKEEAAKHPKAAAFLYQVKATGAVIR